MNLINFHKYPKNEKYIKEVSIDYCGQGLYYSYWVMLFGNGHNKYIFIVEINFKQYKIIIKEEHIIKWCIKLQTCECQDCEPTDDLNFDALGQIEGTGQYIKLENNGPENFNYLNKTFKIIDITIENNYPEIEIVTNITNDYRYCDLLEIRQQNIQNILGNMDFFNKKTINYYDLLDKNNWNKKLFMVMENNDLIPLEIINITKSETNDNIMKSQIYYKGNKCETNIIIINNSEIDDYYIFKLYLILTIMIWINIIPIIY